MPFFRALLRFCLCCGDGAEDETRNINSFQNRQSYDTSFFQSSSTLNRKSFQNHQSYDTSFQSTKSLGKLSQKTDEESKSPLLLSTYSKPCKSVSSSSNLLSPSSKSITSSSKPPLISSSNLYSSSIQSFSSSVKPNHSSSGSSATSLQSETSFGLPTKSTDPQNPSSKPPLTPSSNLYSSSIQSLSSSVKPHYPSSVSSATSTQSKPSFCLPPKSTEPQNPSSKTTEPSTKPTNFSVSHTVPGSASKKLCPALKPTLRQAPSNVTIQQGKNNYIRVEQDSLPLYIIPEDINDLIKRDIVPRVLNNPLSSLTYKDFFAALLYAEDYYCEKWSGFELENVIIELHEAAIYEKLKNHKIKKEVHEKVDKTFVAFQIDSVPEKRPFLLSRDLVKVRPSGVLGEPFQGLFLRVMRSTTVLADFKDDFYSQHIPTTRYDISFSFNRVCLKRAHQALDALSDSLFQNYLFPECVSRNSNPTGRNIYILNKLHPQVSSTVHKILSMKGSPPYLIAGPLCVPEQKKYAFSKKPSITGEIVRESVLQIYESSRKNRILVSAPSNSACDVLMRRLKIVIPESQMFRANAAFREIEDVPDDILSSSLYKRECFSCPSLAKLKEFRVILSTFVSSFRLSNEGLSAAGYFSHIFLVDASLAIEPEAIIPLANFADKNTTVVVTGKPGDCPRWIQSDIARKKGLKISYFERLCECSPYRTLDPKFITELELHEDMRYD